MTDEGGAKAGVIALPANVADRDELGTGEILDARGNPWRPRLSASQIDTYRLCKRKWAWGYIAKIRTPPNKFAALGTAVHKVLENWLRRATQPRRDTETGQIALPGLKYLPHPGQATVEGKWHWHLPDEPFDLVGVIDWLDEVEGVPRVGDHKTTGDFKWVKAPGDLLEDVQATIYAKRTLEQTGAPAVKGRWVYYRTMRPYAARCVDYQATLEQVDRVFAGILSTGREMVGWHRRKAKTIEVPPSVKACDAYGGCPYRDRCDLSAKERLVGLMAHETLKDKIARKKAEKAAQAAAASASGPEATHTPAAPAQPSAAQAAAAPAINPPEGQDGGAKVLIPTTRPGATSGASLKEKMQARRRASAPASPAPVADSVPAPSSVAAPASSGSPEAAGGPDPAPVAEAQPQRPALSPYEPPALETGKATMPPVQEAAVVETQHAVWRGPPPVAAPTNGAAKAKLLLVDCMPLQPNGLQVINLFSLTQGVPPESLAGYLAGCALPDNAAIVMSLATAEGRAAFEAIAARSELVIRGF